MQNDVNGAGVKPFAEDICATIRSLMARYGLSDNATVRYIDFVSEVGELGKALLSNSDYTHDRVDNTIMINNEMGDCLFSLFALITALDVDYAGALNGAIGKYERRFLQRGGIGSDGTPQ